MKRRVKVVAIILAVTFPLWLGPVLVLLPVLLLVLVLVDVYRYVLGFLIMNDADGHE